MKVRQGTLARLGLILLTVFWLCVLVPLSAAAAPYAAMVIDARNGEVLHSRNADTRLHPASLTKMMTLYIAFEAVQNGEISLDTQVRISKNAAAEPPSKLGLRAGQRISLRYLIRAAAIRSSNDAATAIGEAISGSEAKFARRMNRTAKAIGMTRTTFKNAHGLTESGHLSTARDMTILGRQLLFDYPQYYNLFSRLSANAGIANVRNTNRRLLGSYEGADGIKTGYTRAAGFNLVASAKRRRERIIVTVFGGTSGAARDARVAELLDMGFQRAPSRARTRKPRRPAYRGNRADADGAFGRATRDVTAVAKSLRPVARPRTQLAAVTTAQEIEAVADESAIKAEIGAALAQVKEAEQTGASVEAAQTSVAQIALAQGAAEESGTLTSLRPTARPAQRTSATLAAAPKPQPAAASPTPAPPTSTQAQARAADPEPEVVTRLGTDGGRNWGINVGRFASRSQAERVLLKTALAEMATLEGSSRKVVRGSKGFDAKFQGMTRESADLACRRLQARNQTCFMVGPS